MAEGRRGATGTTDGNAAPASTPGLAVMRLIGRVSGGTPGPTLIGVGGVHGNEPAGVHALRRVFERLAWPDIEIRGDFIAFAGNVRALAQSKRYLTRDLNRAWTPERCAALDRERDEPAAGPGDDVETLEQRELGRALETAVKNARGETTFMDLHSTSAAGFPFAVVSDTRRGHEFGSHFPLPVILGLEECLDGLLCDHMSRLGCRTMAVEGGQHGEPGTVDCLAAAVWLALDAKGILARGAEKEVRRAHSVLDQARGDLPRVLEVVKRHAIVPEDEFVMEPGFANIATVEKGRKLARDRHGDIRAPKDGLVVLPLYQGQGEDGFFFAQEMPAWRLKVEASLHSLNLSTYLPLLPGVDGDPFDENRLYLTSEAARLYPMEIFHALGFRRMRPRGSGLVATRKGDR